MKKMYFLSTPKNEESNKAYQNGRLSSRSRETKTNEKITKLKKQGKMSLME